MDKSNADPEPAAIGREIARYRKQKGLTQIDLAGILGVTQPTLANYERGLKMVSVKRLVQLADILEVTTDELLGRTDTPSH